MNIKKLTTTLTLLLCFLGSKAQNDLTIGDVFDFSIGDKFHYNVNTGSQGYGIDKVTITDKWMSAGNDSVFYVREHNFVRNTGKPDANQNPILEFSNRTDTVYYTDLDSIVEKFERFLPWPLSDGAWDTTKVKLNIFEKTTFQGQIEANNYKLYEDNNQVEFSTFQVTFGKGIGEVMRAYYDSQNGNDVPGNYSLIYAYKSGQSKGYGTPSTLSIQPTETADINVYPIPAGKTLIINCSSLITSIQIIDIQGRVVKVINANSSMSNINTEELQNGVYYLRLSTNKGVINRKITIFHM